MYEVRYVDSGRILTTEAIGTEKEIREKFARESKVILSMKVSFALFKKKASSKEVQAVLMALGDLLRIGVQLSTALESVTNSLHKTSTMRSVCLTMLNSVKEGRSLPTAMSGYSHIFGHTIISMVKAGLESGNIAESLILAGNHVKRITAIKSQMAKKLSYPIGVLIVGLISMFINSMFVIPKIINSEMFRMTNSGKPNMFIQALQSISIILPISLGILAASAIALTALFKARQEEIEKVLFKFTLFRDLVFNRSYYVMFFSLSNLIKAGVSLANSLEIVKNSTNLYTIQKEIDTAIKLLKSGENFVGGFQNLTHIDRTMLSVATNSDRIYENFLDIAESFYQKYLEKIESIAPKIYALVMIFVIGIFLLTFMGVFVPYTKILGGIK